MTHSTTRHAPVSVDDLFDPPERGRATISPDGRRIAFLAPWRTRLNVWVAEIGEDGDVDLTSARRVTADDHRAVLDHRWTDDSRHLLYLQDTDGDENHHVLRVDLDEPGSTAVDLTPYPGARVWALHEVPGLTGSVVVSINHRRVDHIDLAEIDVATGALTLLAEGDGAALGWMVTARREVYGLMNTDAGWDLVRRDPDGERHPMFSMSGDDHPLGPALCRPTADGTGFWLGSFLDGDRLRLTRLDLATGEQTEVDSHRAYDLDTQSAVFPLAPGPLITDRGGEVIGVRYSRERQVIHPLTVPFAEVLGAVGTLSDGDVGALSVDRAGRRWVVSFVHDRDPSTWLYDHATGASRLLFRPLARVEPEALAPMHPVTITARDGLEIPSYLFRPVGGDAPGGGAPPMILMPHGGPWARDAWGLDLFAQYFATRGYAVLRPNFRGSTGFGKAHMQAAIGEFGGAMHDDLVDAVGWAVAHGHADPDRVAIFGGSYGGYAALVGVTRTPGLFAAAVDYVGISDWTNFYRTLHPAVSGALKHSFHRYLGDPDDPEQVADMLARSPITQVDRITDPLMIFQGANDVRVVRSESDNIVERLRARGVEVEYRVFADEGHMFLNPENLKTMVVETGRFLAEHLGGRP